jgi:class 3 adenylate cyclase
MSRASCPSHAHPCCARSYFGDTINTASRMESTGQAMCVHVSAATRDAAIAHGTPEDAFECAGEKQVKGKGVMTTYMLRCGEWRGVQTDE